MHWYRSDFKTAHNAYVNLDCNAPYKMLLRVSKRGYVRGGLVLGDFILPHVEREVTTRGGFSLGGGGFGPPIQQYKRNNNLGYCSSSVRDQCLKST